MTKWWAKPDLHRDSDDEEERKVGFLDLFYDLIFVVAVAQLAHDLAHHPDLKQAGQFLLALPSACSAEASTQRLCLEPSSS